jgi:hypothetical protein
MTEYEYTDATLVQAELRATTSFSGSTVPTLSQVQQWIVEESDLINRMAGTVFGVTRYQEYYDYNGDDSIILRHSPVVSLQTVEYNTSALGAVPSWVTKLSPTDFVLDDVRGELILPMTSFSPSEGKRRFRITYVAGFNPVPLNIQMLATKMVSLRVLNSLIYSNVNTSNDGGTVSVGSITITEPASYGVGSYKQLKTDIAELQSSLLKSNGVYRYG